MIHIPGGTEREGARFHHAPQNGAQFKTDELFIFGIFHFIFSDRSWPWVRETAAVGGLPCLLLLLHAGSEDGAESRAGLFARPGFYFSLSGFLSLQRVRCTTDNTHGEGGGGVAIRGETMTSPLPPRPPHSLWHSPSSILGVCVLPGVRATWGQGQSHLHHCIPSSTAQGKSLSRTHLLSKWVNDLIFILDPS